MKLACGCVASMVHAFDPVTEKDDHNLAILQPCNPHKADEKFLNSGGLDRLVGKQVRLRENGDGWIYAGFVGIYRGQDTQFPMDCVVEISHGTVVFVSPDDIQEVLEA